MDFDESGGQTDLRGSRDRSLFTGVGDPARAGDGVLLMRAFAAIAAPADRQKVIALARRLAAAPS